MKSNKTLVLAASILTLTLSAFPHLAAASSAIALPPSGTEVYRAPGGKPVIYLYVPLILAAETLFGAVLAATQDRACIPTVRDFGSRTH